MYGCIVKPESRNPYLILTPTEEETVVRYVVELDSRGFLPQIAGVEDMANLLLMTYDVKCHVALGLISGKGHRGAEGHYAGTA
jgi:hypothetical protein